jgi:pimeloyl-ACP methyl ester carboxylesterase
MDPITRFLDVRALWGGGDVSSKVQLKQWAGGNNFADQTQFIDLAPGDLQSYVLGQDVLIATHGFNVNRMEGIKDLSTWNGLLTLPATAVFLGLLWPGDSESLQALSYPAEPKNAMDAGTMVGQFIDNSLGGAASISFVSHSLGARVVLQAVTSMKTPVRRVILMAGAISDDCLTAEFAGVPQKVEAISVLASKEDDVLRWAFPIGDLVAEIVGHDHPWWESALGRFGPTERPCNFRAPFQIPDEWKYGHGDYLRTDPAASGPLATDSGIPAPVPLPQGGADGWQQAWSAAFVSGRFR